MAPATAATEYVLALPAQMVVFPEIVPGMATAGLTVTVTESVLEQLPETVVTVYVVVTVGEAMGF